MGFNNFKFRVLIRVLLLSITISGILYFSFIQINYVSTGLTTILLVIQISELFRYTSRTNKKLTRFLESIKYSDFVSGFSADDKLGTSFKELNLAFNDVLEAFRQARSEKEEHLLYLNTIVQHVSTGLIAYNEDGDVELINATAKELIDSPQIHNIEELIEKKSRLYKAIFDLPTGKSVLVTGENDVQLAIHATTIKLKGKWIKLIALQNIQPELQKKELEAWQNLTKVLRHEIMNSITPIASLTSTLKDILNEDIEEKGNEYSIQHDTINDIKEGLNTIAGRSNGLISFINAYRDYTNIPRPKFEKISVSALVERVMGLMKVELQNHNVKLQFISKVDCNLEGDGEMLEMVLINLVKNAIEASMSNSTPRITLSLEKNDKEEVSISVIDNGEGIIPEAIEKIFIPFYTTKSKGSGIGLSLSRQIMQLHHGTLTVKSAPGKGSTFVMKF